MRTIRGCLLRGSGLPIPHRRTFAAAIHGLRSLRAGHAFALRATLASKAGSRGMGNPSRKSPYGCRGIPAPCSLGGTPAFGRCRRPHLQAAVFVRVAARGVRSDESGACRGMGLVSCARWTARGCPCRSSGVGNRAQQGLRSEVSSERPEGRMPAGSVRRDGTGSPEPASPRTWRTGVTEVVAQPTPRRPRPWPSRRDPRRACRRRCGARPAATGRAARPARTTRPGSGRAPGGPG
jgi:hypothetical protein